MHCQLSRPAWMKTTSRCSLMSATDEITSDFPFYPPNCLTNNWTAFHASDFCLEFMVCLRFAFVNLNQTIWKIKRWIRLNSPRRQITRCEQALGKPAALQSISSDVVQLLWSDVVQQRQRKEKILIKERSSTSVVLTNEERGTKFKLCKK